PPTRASCTLSLHDALPISSPSLDLPVVQHVQQLLATLVELVLRRAHVAPDAHPVVLAVDVAGMGYDRAIRSVALVVVRARPCFQDRKSTRLNSSHVKSSYA